jgi:hypothetical protein
VKRSAFMRRMNEKVCRDCCDFDCMDSENRKRKWCLRYSFKLLGLIPLISYITLIVCAATRMFYVKFDDVSSKLQAVFAADVGWVFAESNKNTILERLYTVDPVFGDVMRVKGVFAVLFLIVGFLF